MVWAKISKPWNHGLNGADDVPTRIHKFPRRVIYEGLPFVGASAGRVLVGAVPGRVQDFLLQDHWEHRIHCLDGLGRRYGLDGMLLRLQVQFLPAVGQELPGFRRRLSELVDHLFRQIDSRAEILEKLEGSFRVFLAHHGPSNREHDLQDGTDTRDEADANCEDVPDEVLLPRGFLRGLPGEVQTVVAVGYGKPADVWVVRVRFGDPRIWLEADGLLQLEEFEVVAIVPAKLARECEKLDEPGDV